MRSFASALMRLTESISVSIADFGLGAGFTIT